MELRWYQGINRGQWLAMLAAILGWMFDGFEMGLYPLVARPALREMLQEEVREDVRAELRSLAETGAVQRLYEALALDGPAMYAGVDQELSRWPKDAVERKQVTKVLEAPIGQWNSYLSATFLFGAAAGGLVFGWLGDRIGRTKAMIYSVLAYSLFTGLGGFATSAWHLVICRALSSLGMGGEWSLGVALVMEVWPARARPMLAGFIGAASNAGFLLIAVISLVLGTMLAGEVSWRWLMFVGVAPALLTFFIRLFVPESAKWQHAVAGAPKPRVGELLVPGLWQRTLLAIMLSGVALLGTWGAVQWMPFWVDQLIEQAGDVKAPHAKAILQIFSALGAVVGTIIAALVAGRYGRRPTYVLLCLLSLASTQWLYRTPQVYGPLFLFYVFLVGVTTASFYGWIPLYLPELFPTRIRATGQGLSYNFGRIFAALGNIFGTAPLLASFGGSYAETMAAVTLIYFLGVALIWFAPETHGKPLPD